MTITRDQVIETPTPDDLALIEIYAKAFSERRAFDSHLYALKAIFSAGRDAGLGEAHEACEELGNRQGTIGRYIAVQDCMAAITALKGKK